jgi:hypothetical protein
MDYQYNDWRTCVQCVEIVKQQCAKVVAGLILELENFFPAQELLNATKVIYP